MKKKVFVYCHAHFDREWYREFEDFQIRLVEIFDNVLFALENGALNSFYFDGQVSSLMDYLAIKPDKINDIKKFIKNKKLFIGPFFVSSDSFLVSCELYIRNLQLGLNTAIDLGCQDFTGYIPDSFGHSKCIFDIFKMFNIKTSILWRGLSKNLPNVFNFNGIIVVNLKRGYFHDYLNCNKSYKDKAIKIEQELDKINDNSINSLLLPIGADHLNICCDFNNQVEKINKYLNKYKLINTTIFDYIEKINKKTNKYKNINEHLRNNDNTFILSGVLSIKNDIKYNNAILQHYFTRIIEPLNTYSIFSNISNNLYDQINNGIKLLLLNQAHDSIYGCNIDEVNRQIINRQKSAIRIAESLINHTLHKFEKKFSDKTKISIINLSNYSFSGILHYNTEKRLKNLDCINVKKGFPNNLIYDSNRVPITEDYCNIYEYLIPIKDIKPFCVKSYNINNLEYELDIVYDKNFIENRYIKLEIVDNKINLIDKISKKVLNDFIIIKNVADVGDSYNFGALKNDYKILAKLFSYKVKKVNRGIIIFEINFKIKVPEKSSDKGRSKIEKNIVIKLDAILYSNTKYIKFKTKFINKCKNHKMQIGFKFEDNIYEIYCEDLKTITKYEVDLENDIYLKIPAWRSEEIQENIYPFQRFIYYNNIGIVTKGINAAEIYKNTIDLNLLRSVNTISNPKNPLRGTPAGPPIETKELLELKEVKNEFCICFVKKPEDLYEISEHFYSSTEVFEGNCDNIQYFHLDNNKIIVNAIKTNKNNEIIIRLLNISSDKQLCNLKITNLKYSGFYLCDGLENELEKIDSKIIFDKNEIKTIKIKTIKPEGI